MAIFHASVKVHSRSAGRNALKSAAYRAGQKLRDHQTGRVFDFGHRHHVLSRVMLPEHAPKWMADREKLWNAVEASERRSDAQLCREIELALPLELSPERRARMLARYVQEQFVDHGMIADVAIHSDKPENPHAHVLLTMRRIDPTAPFGFGNKVREWNQKARLLEWRSEWANAVNLELARAGIEVRIDARSNAERGIALRPSKKVGVPRLDRAVLGKRRELVRERLRENAQIFRENARGIEANPMIAIDALSHERATFTNHDLARWIGKRTMSQDQFTRVYEAALASAELVLVESSPRETRYTTQGMLAAEQQLVSAAERLAAAKELGRGHKVRAEFIEAVAAEHSLRPEQAEAYEMITEGEGDLVLMEGLAGTGKSYLLGAAKLAWERSGFRVLGAALAGKAAEGLEIQSGIPSRSLASWEHAWQRAKDGLRKDDILVIDEAGMIGTRQLQRILAAAEKAGAKVILVGDSEQLQAIEAGAPFRKLAERFGALRLEDTRRQKEIWQRHATRALAVGDPKWATAALERYRDRGHVHSHATKQHAAEAVVLAWARAREKCPHETQLMLAYRRDEVRALNQLARQVRRRAGELGRTEYTFEVRNSRDEPDGRRQFSVGDRVYFLKNDRTLGVKNGTLGTLKKVSRAGFTIELDPNGHDRGKQITIDPTTYQHLDHGYAATVHKAQGATVDRAHVLASPLFDRHAAYVAMSRHREMVDLHWSRDEFETEREVFSALSQSRPKDMVLDYQQARDAVGRLLFERWAQSLRAEREKEREKEREREVESERRQQKVELERAKRPEPIVMREPSVEPRPEPTPPKPKREIEKHVAHDFDLDLGL